MRVSVIAILFGVSKVLANDNERTVTITNSGWDPRATYTYGRFDHTTRVTTTTVWSGSPPQYGAADNSANSGNTMNAKTGVAGLVLAIGVLML